MIFIRNEEEIERLRASAQLLVQTFRAVESVLEPGVTTKRLDTVAEEAIRSEGGKPAFLGYMGFPASICASIDCEVVHGIPGKQRLEPGQILSLDIGVLKDGYYSDAAKTYAIDDVVAPKKKLIEVTKQALHRGIKSQSWKSSDRHLPCDPELC